MANKPHRRNKRPQHPVQAAIVDLRLHAKMSQSRFAAALGVSVPTLVRYEHTHVPPGGVLARLEKMATHRSRLDLAKVFRAALYGETAVVQRRETGREQNAAEGRGREPAGTGRRNGGS